MPHEPADSLFSPRPAAAAAAALMLGAACAWPGLSAAQTPPVPSAPPRAAPAATGPRLLPLEVTINGAPMGNWTLLEVEGRLYAPADAFEEWRLSRATNAEPVSYRSQAWYPLSSVPGYQARFDFATQAVNLQFSPQAFAATRLSTALEASTARTPSSPAAFANYDLSYTAGNQRGATGQRELGALVELGLTSNLGVLTSTHVGRGLTSSDPAAPRATRRLETTFTRDFPDEKVSLVLGDSSTRSGLWGRPVYFGGFKLTRNFSLAPGFITQPLPVLSGLSSAPSTVELYINDALRQTSQVPTGPFAIDNFPAVAGSGQARVVVRDLLGRETVLVQSFFTSAELLDQGLSDWSVEAGAERQGLGVANADYGHRFASGFWRYGLNKWLTVEGRGEWARSLHNAGVGATAALPFAMLGQAAVAASRHDTAGSGALWLAGVEHDGGPYGFTLRAEGASRGYRQVGQADGTLLYRLQLSATFNYASQRWGSFGASFARIDSYDRGPLSSLGANYTIRVGERASVTVSALRVTGPSSASSVGVTLLVPMDGQTLSAGASHKGGLVEGYAGASRNLSESTGLGWRTLAGSRSRQPFAEGGVYYQGTRGLLTADLNAGADQQTLRLGAVGGVVAMDGQVFASRRLDDSFALVEVPGLPGIGIGFQGSSLTRTDAHGKALLPRLLPFQPNSIRLNANELPISAEIDSIEQIVVPAGRAAVKVTFPVRTGRAALLRVVLDDGEPAPAGAEIRIEGDKQDFFVARRGEAFVTGLQPGSKVTLTHKGQRCALAFELPPGQADDIARVGPLSCKGVKR
jgi:outer membrane usher protein